MEENSRQTVPANDDTLEVSRSVRDVPPAHYTFKIESFSLLSQILVKSGVEKYESSDFEAGGYKWRLVLYPNGNKKSNVDDHISLYLAMSETNDLPLGWEVNVTFRFLVYDQISDKYLTLQDGKVWRFHALKTQRGIPRLLSLTTLNHPSNGYLVDDYCVFGAEVFVIKCEGKGESFSIIKEPKNATYTWKLDKFSGLKEEKYCSESFIVGSHQWKLSLHPNGDSRGEGKYLSIQMSLAEYSDLRHGWKLYLEFKLSVKDQVYGKHRECGGNDSSWYDASDKSWGYSDFMLLSDLNDVKKGFLVNDTLIVEAKINVMSVVSYFA